MKRTKSWICLAHVNLHIFRAFLKFSLTLKWLYSKFKSFNTSFILYFTVVGGIVPDQDLDPWDPEYFRSAGSVIICTDPDPSINKLKNLSNLDFYSFVTIVNFVLIALKIDANEPTESKKQRKTWKNTYFLLASWKPLKKIPGAGSWFAIQRYRYGSGSKRHGSGTLVGGGREGEGYTWIQQ
jgi:hypothetical protein